MNNETKQVISALLAGRNYIYSLLHTLLGAEPTKEIAAAATGEAAFQAIANYLKAAAPLMDGGFAAACDYACKQWLLPLAADHPDLVQALQEALVGLPCAEDLKK